MAMERFDREGNMDNDFIQQNLMGPSALRIIEELTETLTLPSKARILDLGCGTGLTSIFLARKYEGSSVFATDLWIEATDNFGRFASQGLQDRIIPIHAEAHELPFAHGYFDAIVSVDSYQYFGVDATFLDEHIAPLLKAGGTLAVSMPGLRKGITQEMLPEALTTFWGGENIDFYALRWWEELWSESNQMERVKSFSHTCHKRAWDEWLSCDNPHAKHDIDMMRVENGKFFDTIGLIYRKKA